MVRESILHCHHLASFPVDCTVDSAVELSTDHELMSVSPQPTDNTELIIDRDQKHEQAMNTSTVENWRKIMNLTM